MHTLNDAEHNSKHMQIWGTGIIEHVGWTNGSTHQHVALQPWPVGTMADVVLAAAGIAMALVCAASFAVQWVLRCIDINRSTKRLIQPIQQEKER